MKNRRLAKTLQIIKQIIPNTKIFEVVLLLALGIIPLFWYRTDTLAFGHDMGFPLAPIDHFIDRTYTWTERVSPFGSDQTESLNGVFIHGLEWVVASLGASLLLTQQITFIFWFILPGLTMYTLLNTLHPEKKYVVLRISGALLYIINYYMLQAWTIAERTKFSIVAALPLVVLILVNLIQKKSSPLKQAILFSITLFLLNGGAGIPLWGGVLITVIVTAGVLIRFSPQSFGSQIKRFLIFSLLSLIFLLLLNSYWIIPSFESFTQNLTEKVKAAGGTEGVVSWSIEISKNASYMNLLKMQGIADWYNNPEHPYANTILNRPIFVFFSVLFPIIAFISLLNFKASSREVVIYKTIFLALLIVSIPFSAGSHPPSGEIYNFLLTYLPGFSMFRTPIYKFGMVLWFAYAYLIAYGLQKIAHKIDKNIVVLAIFLTILGTYYYPVFNGDFFNWSYKYSTMVKVPEYIFDVKRDLDSNQFSTRALLLPNLNPGNLYESYDWGYFSLNTVPSMLSRSSVVINNNFTTESEKVLLNSLYDQLHNNGDSPLLGKMGVDRVYIREDYDSPQEGSYLPSQLINKLRNSKAFITEKKFGRWEAFSTKKQSRPLFSLSKSLMYIDESAKDDYASVNRWTASVDDVVFLSGRTKNSALTQPSQELLSGYSILGEFLGVLSLEKDYTISSELPEFLPGSIRYNLQRWFSDTQTGQRTANQNIDLYLSRSLKDMSALHLKILNPISGAENLGTVGYILNNIKNDLNNTKKLYLSLEDDQEKVKYSRKIFDYVDFFVNQNPKLIKQAKLGESKRLMSQFKFFVENYIDELKLNQINLEAEGNRNIFRIDAPEEGKYAVKLKLSNKSYAKFFTALEKDDERYLLKWDDQLNNGVMIKDVFLKAGKNLFSLDQVEPILLNVSSLEILGDEDKDSCQVVDVSQVERDSVYNIKFKHTSDSDYQLNVFVKTEKLLGDDSIDSKKVEILSPISIKKKQETISETNYMPEGGVDKFSVHVCAKTNPDVGKFKVSLSDFKVLFNLRNPLIMALINENLVNSGQGKLEFRKLNQTKYLVKIKPESQSLVLVFNSRFDQGWNLKEINQDVGDKFWAGDSKDYSEYGVTEYPALDKHFLSDQSLGIKLTKDVKKHFPVDGYANAWELSSLDNGEHTYLLEYHPQKTYYTAVLITVFTLFSLILVYLVYAKKQS